MIANMHFSAIEQQDTLVFLHAIKPGAANQSYGLQVAQLAGLPAAVLKLAKTKLRALEFNTPTHAPVASIPDTNSVTITAAQGALLADLAKIDPDQLTPHAALQLIYQWRQILRDAE